VAKSVAIPVMIGSGVTVNNLHLYPKANALIIGSHFKYDGRLVVFSVKLFTIRFTKLIVAFVKIKKKKTIFNLDGILI